MMNFFGNPLLEKALDASWTRNKAISENLSNVDTPGYKRKDVNFEEYLKASLDKEKISEKVSNSRHIQISKASTRDGKLRTIRDYNSTSMRLDGNNVDVDSEMAELAKNQILYNTYTSLLNKDFSMIKSAIREGR